MPHSYRIVTRIRDQDDFQDVAPTISDDKLPLRYNHSAGKFELAGDIPVTSEVYNCDSGLEVGKAVYVSESDTVAYADASAPTAGRGIIRNKPTATTCVVQYTGELDGFSGLTPNTVYFLSTNGDLTDTAPTSPTNDGWIVQRMAFARSSTKLVVLPYQEPTLL